MGSEVSNMWRITDP